MEINSGYTFFFVGGTCGSFVKCIFYHYLHTLSLWPTPVIFEINSTVGDCHVNNLGPNHQHRINDLDTSKQIIAINFDNNDKPTIIKMAFHKSMKYHICKNPDILKTNWNGELKHIDPFDFDLLEKTFIENPNYLIFPDWKTQLAQVKPELTIQFKDILYGNLNEIIANFLQTPQLPEVDQYINKYRTINKKYVDIDQ